MFVLPRHAPTSVPLHARPLSIASLFRRPTPLPPPSVVANVTKLEAEADANPEDVEKQVALFEALVNTKVKPGLNTVVARWERTCEFVSSLPHALYTHPHCMQNPSHPLLRSDTAFKFYLTALRDLGLDSSISAAVRRRESLLAASAPAAASVAPQATIQASNDPFTADVPPPAPQPVPSFSSNPTVAAVASTSSSVSASQQAAQEVLAGKPTVTRSVNTDFDALGAALSRGAGVPGNPIVVTLSERKSVHKCLVCLLSATHVLVRHDADGGIIYPPRRMHRTT